MFVLKCFVILNNFPPFCQYLLSREHNSRGHFKVRTAQSFSHLSKMIIMVLQRTQGTLFILWVA